MSDPMTRDLLASVFVMVREARALLYGDESRSFSVRAQITGGRRSVCLGREAGHALRRLGARPTTDWYGTGPQRHYGIVTDLGTEVYVILCPDEWTEYTGLPVEGGER